MRSRAWLLCEVSDAYRNRGNLTLLYHGTSLKQLQRMRCAAWVVRNLYVSDLSDEPEHYADVQARHDRSVPAYLVIDSDLLTSQVSQDATPEWEDSLEEGGEIEESYRAHTLLSGSVRHALLRAFYVDDAGDEHEFPLDCADLA
jgi:hypothetical protein